MSYNPEIHHRRSIRLKDYDYSQAGAYFITICCDNKLHRFGEISVETLKGQPHVGAIPCGCPPAPTGIDKYNLLISNEYENDSLISNNGENKLNDFNEISVGAGFTPALFTNQQNNEIIKNNNINKSQLEGKGQPHVGAIPCGCPPAPTGNDKHNLLISNEYENDLLISNNGENKLNDFNEISVGAGFTPALFTHPQNNEITKNNNINKSQLEGKGQPHVGAIPCGCPPAPTGIDKYNLFISNEYENDLLISNNIENKLNDFNEISVGAGFTPALFTHQQNNEIIKNNHINESSIMQLNEYGQIAYNEWIKLNERFQNIELDVFQIMPNHIHGIIVLNDVSQKISPSISNIIGSYKSLVANECLKIYKNKNDVMGKLWQRNYYEIIIRNEKSYQIFSEYIINNPARWQEDKFYNI